MMLEHDEARMRLASVRMRLALMPKPFAEKLGMKPSAYLTFEKAGQLRPDVSWMRLALRLNERLGLSIDWLLFGKGNLTEPVTVGGDLLGNSTADKAAGNPAVSYEKTGQVIRPHCWNRRAS